MRHSSIQLNNACLFGHVKSFCLLATSTAPLYTVTNYLHLPSFSPSSSPNAASPPFSDYHSPHHVSPDSSRGYRRLSYLPDPVWATTRHTLSPNARSSLGYAFHLAAELDGDLTPFLDRIEDAVVQADEVDQKFLQYEGGVGITCELWELPWLDLASAGCSP